MTRISFQARQMVEGAIRDVGIVLMEFKHPALEKPLRLSTDNTDFIGEMNGRDIYGTRSRWRGADPLTEPYLFLNVAVELPQDRKEAPPAARFVLADTDASITEELRKITTPATCALAAVRAAAPDTPEEEFLNLELTVAESENGALSLSFGRTQVGEENFPALTMDEVRFPCLRVT